MDKNRSLRRIAVWVVALLISLIAFYGLDHFVMNIQGLPLNWDLTPAS